MGDIDLQQLVQAERLKHTARLRYLQLPMRSELCLNLPCPECCGRQSQCISCVSAGVGVRFKQIDRRMDDIDLQQLVQAERLKRTQRTLAVQLSVRSELCLNLPCLE